MWSGHRNRREFLSDVGRSMLVAGLGYTAARELGLTRAFAEEVPAARLRFSGRDDLVDLLQSTPVDRFLPWAVEQIRRGVTYRELIAAAALANARAFGGEDYVGFHTFMALMPALRMAEQLPTDLQALPILKVLYRHVSRVEEFGHHDEDTLRPVAAQTLTTDPESALREAVRAVDRTRGDGFLIGMTTQSPEESWNSLLPVVSEAPEVHRIVLAHRAWDMLGLVGREHADTMLRQSLHYCMNAEPNRQKNGTNTADMVANVLERCRLSNKNVGTQAASEDWVAEFSHTLLTCTPNEAAQATGEAIAQGISAQSISQAVAVTANQLVLRDPGRPKAWAQANKPEGSVHGDSIGVHASDTANAWRQIVEVSNPRNAIASLILSAWCVARDGQNRKLSDFAPRPLAEHLETVTTTDPAQLLTQLEGAIREQQQDQACALTSKYLDAGHVAGPVFSLLLKYACSEDGALHGEKYFWTVQDEFARQTPRFRNGQLIALARVTASEHGTPAPGIAEAKDLLGLV